MGHLQPSRRHGACGICNEVKHCVGSLANRAEWWRRRRLSLVLYSMAQSRPARAYSNGSFQTTTGFYTMQWEPELLSTLVHFHSNRGSIKKASECRVYFHLQHPAQFSKTKSQNAILYQYSSNPSALISRMPCSTSSTRVLILLSLANF